MPLLAIHYTRSPVLVAGVAVAQGLPWLLFSLPAGVVVDRTDRRRMMVTADIVRAVVMIVFSYLVLAKIANLVHLYIIAFILNTAETLHASAVQAAIPRAVGDDDEALDAANGRLENVEVAGQEFVGPAFGGLVFALALSAPFLLDGATFAASAVLVWRLRGNFSPAETPTAHAGGVKEGLRRDIAEGARYIWRQPVLRMFIVLLCLLAFVQGGMWGLLVLYARDNLHVAAGYVGLLFAISAVGDVAGGFATSRIRAVLGAARTLQAALFLVAAGYLVMGSSSRATVFTVGLGTVGFAVVVARIILISIRQRLTPDRLLGRVSSTFRLATMSMTSLGALAGGLTAQGIGLRDLFLLCAALQAILSLTVFPLLGRRLQPAALSRSSQ